MLSSEDKLKFAEQFAEQLNMYRVERDKTNNLIRLRSQTNALIEIKRMDIIYVRHDFFTLSSRDGWGIAIKRYTDHWDVSVVGCRDINITITNIKIPLDEGDKLRDDLCEEKTSRGIE
jgi:hypothetical protein